MSFLNPMEKDIKKWERGEVVFMRFEMGGKVVRGKSISRESLWDQLEKVPLLVA